MCLNVTTVRPIGSGRFGRTRWARPSTARSHDLDAHEALGDFAATREVIARSRLLECVGMPEHSSGVLAHHPSCQNFGADGLDVDW